MAKSKTKQSKAQPAEPVKKVEVTKPAQTPKTKSKDAAKSAAKKVAKETKKKAAKSDSSDDSSEEEKAADSSDSDSEASDSSSASDSEKVKKPVVKKPVVKAKANGKVKAESSDSESESDSDSEEVDAKANGSAKAAPVAKSDSSDSDSDEESDEKKPAAKAAGSDDSEDDSDDSDDSEEDSSSESAEATPASKKRKADGEIDATPKKAKTDDAAEAASTLFVGSLSWGTDDGALWEAFKNFQGVVNARVVMDKLSGKSRGFGYVDFSDPAAATKAFDAMQGHELDGRTLNLDYANARSNDATPRDRAADRAKKHGDSVSPESDTLFVGNLPFGVDQESVREFFSASREVASVRLPTDPETGNLKGFGYVSFSSVEDAKSVLQELNGASIGEGRSARNIRLDYASSRPPREGGSFGGGGFGGGRSFGGNRGGGRGRGGDRGRGDRGRGRGRGGPRGGPRGGGGYSGTKTSFD
ncbi:hypothetical protein G6O67_001567 [Ophiocordyceps sinensis]|uniref:RRM domain-containing protein n=1 Tax=Ophiocordyceps sinensis TaxID=72228 RepID=A0A8H4PXM8_9HYPO|nr:hypothetical protein G6O67_001567 [Ophiocordyceps sinensis]